MISATAELIPTTVAVGPSAPSSPRSIPHSAVRMTFATGSPPLWQPMKPETAIPSVVTSIPSARVR